jgi:hypothetical protein
VLSAERVRAQFMLCRVDQVRCERLVPGHAICRSDSMSKVPAHEVAHLDVKCVSGLASVLGLHGRPNQDKHGDHPD